VDGCTSLTEKPLGKLAIPEYKDAAIVPAMKLRSSLEFKIASEPWEYDLIHRLNYRTFVEEIPQHQPSAGRRLIDAFHAENTYVICMDGRKLAGMVAFRGRRPFSLDQKLERLDDFLPPGRRCCEVRLLAVDRRYRNGQVVWGLVRRLVETVKARGYNLAVISGNARHEKLYRCLGFTPFGPLVGKSPVHFQPMYLTLESLEERLPAFLPPSAQLSRPPASFLPGPVAIHPSVQEALGTGPVSHRSASFHEDLADTKQRLCALTKASRVELFVGSGTLANDVVAGQLSLLRQPGLVLSNGEFGRRLADHASRWGLNTINLAVEWGQPFDPAAIRRQVTENRDLGWLWAVHCETSTGVLNDLDMLRRICAIRRLKLCLDCISSIGLTPVDLRGVYLASGVSGKGLGAFPGLSFVFYHHAPEPAPSALPRYLDLGYYVACAGVPFTISSNLLHALQTALERMNSRRFQRLAQDSAWLRAELRKARLHVLASESDAAPGVVTIALPPSIDSRRAADRLARAGYLLSFGSEYLVARNWIQVCLMGEYTRASLYGLLSELGKLNSSTRPRHADARGTGRL
jgi:aspartate aminotransferase-like enzyme